MTTTESNVRNRLYGQMSGKVHLHPEELRPAFSDEWDEWQDQLLEEDREQQRQQEDRHE
jgi:hypothetical protein